MKILTITASLISMASLLAIAQVEIPNEPQWQVTIKVVDEDGLPVTNADVSATYYIPPPPNATEAASRRSGLTDANGLVTLSARSGPWVGCEAGKTGYYSTSGLKFTFTNSIEDHWQPWNPAGTFLLKKIANPIPMYARWINSEPRAFKKTGRPPIVFKKDVGYDLTVGDWVVPYGKGKVADIIFTDDFSKQSANNIEDKLTISFPNPGDGIQEFTISDAESRSALRSPYEAPVNGYQPQLIRESFNHPGQASQMDYDPKRNYFFRVRTEMDSYGNVKSALYGKLYGDPMQMNFHYYLNPTPNSQNVEFDPQQNLLGGLRSFESVNAP